MRNPGCQRFFFFPNFNKHGIFHPRYFEKGPLEPERHNCLQILFLLLKQRNILFEEPMQFFIEGWRRIMEKRQRKFSSGNNGAILCPFLHCKALRTAMYKRYINSIIIIIIIIPFSGSNNRLTKTWLVHDIPSEWQVSSYVTKNTTMIPSPNTITQQTSHNRTIQWSIYWLGYRASPENFGKGIME